jgi:hypothetical protein
MNAKIRALHILTAGFGITLKRIVIIANFRPNLRKVVLILSVRHLRCGARVKLALVRESFAQVLVLVDDRPTICCHKPWAARRLVNTCRQTCAQSQGESSR